MRANPRHLNCFDIRVEADGFVQGKENVPRVPLVTEELLGPARRLLKALNQLVVEQDLREKEDIPLPASHGNTITGIDIVLDQAGKWGR